jgi:hypothetical protein
MRSSNARQGDVGQARIIRFAPPGEVLQAPFHADERRVDVIPFAQQRGCFNLHQAGRAAILTASLVDQPRSFVKKILRLV